MYIKTVFKRTTLSILLSGILLNGAFASATTNNDSSYSAPQLLLLNEIKKQTIEMVEKQKHESELLRTCFAFPTLCPGDITQKLPTLRQAIREKSEEYRLLVGLARSSHTFHGHRRAKLSLAHPSVILRAEGSKDNPSEMDMIRELYRKDLTAIRSTFKDRQKTPPSVPMPLHPYVSYESIYMAEELRDAEVFYEMQALLLANQLPFIVYLESDRHSDGEIVNALGVYIKRIQEVLNDLYDENKTPLEGFLLYEPIVQVVISKNPDSKEDLRALFLKQQPKAGLQAWIARNSPSLKLAALTSCSLVSAILQSWPISLACSGTAAVLTSHQLYKEYHRMRDDFALWLLGAQSHNALRSTESRMVYSTFALFLSGQALSSTILSIETGLVATLSSIPSVAAARFTSLSALREGGLRFFSRTIQWKGKDLGASLLAQDFSNITDSDLSPRRQDRIFTYADYLRFNQMEVSTSNP